jgi:Opioid growth factor receptor (OGFr) conserved region
MSPIVDFYAGQGHDHRGRKLDEILAWDNSRLESTHDYIQWLFPLPEPSRFNSHAPLLTEADCAAFKQRPELAANMLRSLKRMLEFYGFSLNQTESGGLQNTHISLLPDNRQHWLSPGDHNYLRISRILRSLRLVALGRYTTDFFNALSDLYRARPDDIGCETFHYWHEAAGR